MQRATQDIFKTTKGSGYYAKKGDWIPLSNVQTLFVRARARAGLTDCRIHDLRHTYASKLIRRGVPILSVSRLLGHQTIDMTLRYSHLAPAGLDDEVAKLDFPRDGRRDTKPPPQWNGAIPGVEPAEPELSSGKIARYVRGRSRHRVLKTAL
jgi:hypothetical protein